MSNEDVVLVVLKVGVRAGGRDVAPGNAVVTRDARLAEQLVRDGLAARVRNSLTVEYGKEDQ